MAILYRLPYHLYEIETFSRLKLVAYRLSYFQNSFTISYVYLAIEMAILYRLPYHLYEIETFFAIKISSLSFKLLIEIRISI